jgi:YVTN family beta-propeller protein
MKKSTENLFSLSLITIVLVLLAANVVCATGVIGTITVGKGPSGIAYDSGKSEIFVANTDSQTVSVISDSTNTVIATVTLGTAGTNPENLAYDSGKGEIFVTDSAGNAVSIISDSTNTVIATLPMGNSPIGIAYDSGKSEIFVTSFGLTASVLEQTPSATGGVPTPPAQTISGIASVISDKTNAVVATVPVGTSPYGVAYDAGKGEIFVTNTYSNSNSVFVISDSTNSVVATIPVGNQPFFIACDSGKGELFVANSGDNTVSVISDSTNVVVATIPVGIQPEGVAYDADKGEIYVTNYGSNTISVISDITNTVVANIPIVIAETAPSAIAYDPDKGEIFVANFYADIETGYISNTVLVLSDSSGTPASSSPTISMSPTQAGSISPTPTVPEFGNLTPILVAVALVVMTFCAIALKAKATARTSSDSKEITKLV